MIKIILPDHRALQRIFHSALRSLYKHEEHIHVEGIMRFRKLPEDWTREEYERIYCAMSPRERERYTAFEVHNILTANGRASILAYMSSTTATTAAFAQYFATGTGAIGNVFPADIALSTENFRVAPSSATIVGTQVDILSQMGTTQAVGFLTNAGLFGVNATATSGSGTLNTHALLNSFNKDNLTAYSVDYLLNLT